MCYSLYGNDIDINTSPIEAGLDWLIDKSNNSFIGSETMKNQKKIIYFSIKERGIPRKGHKIIYKKKEIGHVTSGTFSTTLKNGIGFGYLTTDLDTVNYGEEIEINANGRSIVGLIVKPPFITDTSIQD